MNSTNIDITISSGGGQQASARASASTATSSGTEGAFGQLFAQAHRSEVGKRSTAGIGTIAEPELLGRQEIADDGSNPLVALTISPQFEVITPGTFAPNPDSVEAFARSQGLDDETVKWLFNGTALGQTTQASLAAAVALTPPAISEQLTAAVSTPANLALTDQAGTAVTNPALFATSLASGLGALPIQMASAAGSTTDASTGSAQLPTLRSALFPTLAGQFAQHGSAGGSSAAAAAGGDLGKMIANDLRALLTGSQSGQAIQQSGQAIQSTQATLAITAEVPGTIAGTASPGPGDQTAGKPVVALATGIGAMIANGLHALQTAPQTTAVTLDSAQAAESTTEPILLTPAMSMQAGLLRMPGAKPVTTPAQNATRFAEVLVETIDLESELVKAADPDSPVEAAPRSESGGSTATPVAADSLGRRTLQLSGPAHGAPAAESSSGAAQADKISELADRLGQAIGQRLVSAMERGQWQLKLMLKPAQLGHIEVEMRMRNGELDASFLASQAATRELLQDGLGRLKSTLNGLGMDVASMHVGDGQARQFGEKPTQDKQAQARTNTVSRENDPVATGSTAAIRNRSGSDGLDVMV